MEGYRLISENKRFKYYITVDGKLARTSKNIFKELGYIEDNLTLYKKLCESI